MTWWRRLLQREQFERRLDAELSYHLDRLVADHMRAGLSEQEARRKARLEFGGLDQIKEVCRDEGGVRLVDEVTQDSRYALRTLVKNPGFALIAILMLALGIGANTAIFSVVNAVLLRPLPYADDDGLAVILHRGKNPVSPANFMDWRAGSHAFARMGAAEYWRPNLTEVDQPEHLFALRLTADVLPMLGVHPQLGRVFAPDEDQPGRERVVIIGDGLWRRRFAANPQIVGASIHLDGQLYTVIGVMPPAFMFAPFWATRAEVWAPLALGPRVHDRRGDSLRVFARLAPGVTLERARVEMAAITAGLEEQYPGTNREIQVLSLREKVVGQSRSALLVLLGAVGFVLLMACANVAHMLLARAAGRQKEIAVRAALGATRARMVRQLLTESLLLAFLGAGAGLLLAAWGIRGIVALSPAEIPRVDTVGLDMRVLAFVVIAALVTGIVFGLVPALQSSVIQSADVLKETGRGSTDSKRRGRLRDLLVASEFAVAVVLLVGAGLMIRSFAALQAIDPGFNPSHVLTMSVSLLGSSEAEPGRRVAFYRQLLQQIQALPDVSSVSAINHLPLAGDTWGLPFAIQGRPASRPGEAPIAVYRTVLPDYFRTMGIPILRGRDVGASDTLSAPSVVAVNETLAAQCWPGEDAVGKQIAFDNADGTPHWLTIIAVVRNTRQSRWTGDLDPEAYLPVLQSRDYLENPKPHFAYLTLILRTSSDPQAMAPAVRSRVLSIDKNVVISEVQTMDDVVAAGTAQPRFYLLLLSSFGAVALTLAAVGIYGVMSYSVSRRTHEIGVRLSLGAQGRDVARLLVGHAMMVALAGALVGGVGALATSQAMSTLLYGVHPTDPMTFVAVLLVLGAVALAASYLPVRRATRIDPLTALRQE